MPLPGQRFCTMRGSAATSASLVRSQTTGRNSAAGTPASSTACCSFSSCSRAGRGGGRWVRRARQSLLVEPSELTNAHYRPRRGESNSIRQRIAARRGGRNSTRASQPQALQAGHLRLAPADRHHAQPRQRQRGGQFPANARAGAGDQHHAAAVPVKAVGGRRC